MADSIGNLCIVLHGHLPYVLHHGSYPHGEAWLYEAAAETYLPLLDVIGEAALYKSRPAITMGLTPILLEQLSHERFKGGFVAYLHERIERATSDRKEFEQKNELHFAYLAGRWAEWFGQKLEHFERIKRDIPAEFGQRFREGHIQILTSNATHGYMPLLLNDEMCRAQMKAGTFTSKRILGTQPRGMWLPECAYRPTWEHWLPAVLYDNARYRPGIENFIADAGVTHFFVDTHLVSGGQPMGVLERGDFRAVNETTLHWDHRRGWRSVLEPVGVVSKAERPRAYAFARHPKVSEQVWSGSIGYPGAGQYLEFHRKYGERGLRYHKVTSNTAPLSDKHPYFPDDVKGKTFEHARHFLDVVKGVLHEYRNWTGRKGTVVAPFDAELFGHWWFEGPQFLRDVILTCANDPEVKLATAEEALYGQDLPDKVVRMPEGSWGENGNHSVWINDRNKWMWEIEYRAEGRMLQLLHGTPWQTDNNVKQMMERAGRELLLLQASDWPFVVHTHGAVDYGIQRFSGHATRFDRATTIAEKLAKGGQMDDVERVQVAEMDAHDSVFPQIDLDWWMHKSG
ncbi:MAG TPA: 1,4-alpha-glucan branching protein domain-containing protein [Tepidisphaeraceae bacterium]|nr:1,4-alpha-glucan branching protein domain-containing protein [Tepidisphaeraceae bacterium]